METMENHYYDDNGIYVSSAPANPGTLPPDRALRIPPPEREGFWPVLNASGDGWTLVEDHRGRVGWRDGAREEIAALGPFPDGWSAEPPPPPAITDPDELRRIAFAIEADPLRDRALSYRLEAEALRHAGEGAAAARAEAKCRRELAAYGEKKREIRARHPKAAAAAEETDDMDGLVYLTGTGVYHREGCEHTVAAGKWIMLSALREKRPGAKPCRLCRPDGI